MSVTRVEIQPSRIQPCMSSITPPRCGAKNPNNRYTPSSPPLSSLPRYDIPVLHVNGMYWTKHRLSVEDAAVGIKEARSGPFAERRGEPDASRLERE